MKKLILACASLLAFSGVAVGEDVTSNNVIYTIKNSNSSNGNLVIRTDATTISANVGNTTTNATITINQFNNEYDQTVTFNYFVEPKSISTTIPTINSWSYSENSYSYNKPFGSGTFKPTDSDYSKVAEAIRNNSSNLLYSYSEAKSLGAAGFLYWTTTTNTIEEDDGMGGVTTRYETVTSRNTTTDIDIIPNHEKYYYYRFYNTSQEKYFFFAVNLINSGQNNGLITVTNIKNYYCNNIPSGISLTNVTSLIIGTDITSITAGAFAGASKLKNFTSESSSFEVDDVTGLLYTKDFVALVAVPAGKTGDIKLNDACSSIYNSACANVSNVNLISTRTSVSYTDLGGSGNKVTVSKTALDKENTNGGVTANAGQILTQTNVNAIITSNGSGRFIDLSSCRKPEGTLTISGLVANCLLFLPAGTTVNGNPANVIIGGENGSCNNFVLTDKKTFYSPYDFIAYNVTYERAFTKDVWATICLPFTMPQGDFNNKYKFARLTGYDSKSNKFTFTISSAGQMNGKTPYLINKLEDYAPINFNSPGGIQVWNTPSMTPSVSASEAKMFGIFETGHTASPVQNESIAYGFNTSGSFVRFNNTTINPFRAYITAPWSAYYGSSAPEIRFIDEDGFDLDSSETAIEYVETENNNNISIFNLNGQRVIDTSVPGMYINNNKKVLIK